MVIREKEIKKKVSKEMKRERKRIYLLIIFDGPRLENGELS